MKRIAIFQRDLGVGGIQRSLRNLLTGTDLSGYIVDLYLFEPPSKQVRRELKNTNVYVLKPLFYMNRLVPIHALERTFSYTLPRVEYDLAIDYSSYSNECALCCRQIDAKRRMMWIHNDLSLEYRNNRKYRMLFRAFRGKYRDYDAFAAVSDGIVEPFRRMTGIDERTPIYVIPNMINTQLIFARSEIPVDFRVDPVVTNFIFVGRFTYQKGIDILLENFREALNERNDIQLYLLGDGEEKPNILRQIEALDLTEFVTVLPAAENPYPYMAQMDALVLTSRHEGQGMVLLEGKALGLDLIFPKHLEKYNDDLVGCEDVTKAIVAQQKKTERKRDTLDRYNLAIKNSLYALFDEDA